MRGENKDEREDEGMKRFLALLLALSMAFALCGCGESAELKSVKEQIAAIGEVDLDSEAAIVAAEEAYQALSEEDKAKVDNYAELTAAREVYEEAKKTAEMEEARKALVGEWVEVYSAFLPYAATSNVVLTEDGNADFDGLGVSWRMSEDMRSVEFSFGDTVITSFEIADYDGIMALVGNQTDFTSSVYVRREDYQSFVDQRFVAVEINSDNIGEYIGEYVKVGDELDDFGDVMGEACMFRSKAIEQGLVYVGRSDDFVFEIEAESGQIGDMIYGAGEFPVYDPFSVSPRMFFSVSSFGRAKGTLYFVRAENVAENGVEMINGLTQRVVRLTDGTAFLDSSGFYWKNTSADYNDWKY